VRELTELLRRVLWSGPLPERLRRVFLPGPPPEPAWVRVLRQKAGL
jgi:hypothetical protein